MDALANDLANANTTGYKRIRVGFRDLLYEQAGRPAAEGSSSGAAPAPSTPAAASRRARCATPATRSTSPSRATASSRSAAPTAVALTRDGGLHLDATAAS